MTGPIFTDCKKVPSNAKELANTVANCKMKFVLIIWGKLEIYKSFSYEIKQFFKMK